MLRNSDKIHHLDTSFKPTSSLSQGKENGQQSLLPPEKREGKAEITALTMKRAARSLEDRAKIISRNSSVEEFYCEDMSAADQGWVCIGDMCYLQGSAPTAQPPSSDEKS